MALGLLALLLLPVRPAHAQGLVRPFDEWRTIRTAHFAFHYQRELEDWTRFVAARIEAVDSGVTRLVGNAPGARVDVLVEDPYNMSNGEALPFLDHPVIIFWATPPDPRDEIGEFRTWGEMLSTHEFAHIAHLARPSRNPFRRRFWELMPVNLGPIPLEAPRWAIEGYATYVEGHLTGTGRPYGTWRPALLREWAIEGHLPTYAQLSGSETFNGGSFAYLVGSAYLEWLTRRQGDSSLVAVWRRMTAREPRSFDAAFAGVFGDGPAELYGRFTADVTAKAMEVERSLSGDTLGGGGGRGLVAGELVQHLAWATGDPALSPDGRRVALVLRSQVLPSRVVVWGTAAEPDTMEARRAAELLRRDPEDVPARRFYPAPKKRLATLLARGGLSYEDPRFLPDGRRVLVWRYTPRGDGTLRPDIYEWDTMRGSVRRVTRGAAVREPDPSPDGRTAAAVRCAGGHCDLVLVDLTTGGVTTLVGGTVDRSFYRPRFSPDGASIAVAVQQANRWRIAVVDTRSGALRLVGPDDGASRYDAAWLSATTLVEASDRGGIPNVERLDLATAAAQPLTRVTGAALAPEPNRHDGSLWFLTLHARGYDLRRLAADSAPPSPPVVLDPRLAPVVPPPSPGVVAFAPSPVAPPRAYGVGPRVTRWIPAPVASADGAGALLAIADVDPVGRLGLSLVGAAGTAAAWRGASLGAVWRGLPAELQGRVFLARQTPSAVALDGARTTAHDGDVTGAVASVAYGQQFDLWRHAYRLGGSLGSRTPDAGPRVARDLAFARFDGRYRQMGDGWQLGEGLAANADAGSTNGRAYRRLVLGAALTSGGPRLWPLSLAATYGRAWGDVDSFEQFAVGGAPAPVVDDAVLPQRITMPALPTATLVGDRVVVARAGTSVLGLAPFYWVARTDTAGAWSRRWHRVYGLGWAVTVPPMPPLGLPGARIEVGAARSLDAPFAHRVRGWAVVQIQP